MTARRRWRRRRQGDPRRGDLIRQLQQDLMPVAPPSLLVLLWRWRWELGIVLGLPAGLTLLIIRLGWLSVPVVITAVVAAAGCPYTRYWLIARTRCIVTAHRVRTGCAQAWIQTRYGKLPVILMTRPQHYGERVYIWCRAGICPEDFQAARNILRTACWATDIYVTTSTTYSQIVILDIIRDRPGD